MTRPDPLVSALAIMDGAPWLPGPAAPGASRVHRIEGEERLPYAQQRLQRVQQQRRDCETCGLGVKPTPADIAAANAYLARLGVPEALL